MFIKDVLIHPDIVGEKSTACATCNIRNFKRPKKQTCIQLVGAALCDCLLISLKILISSSITLACSWY